MAAGVRGGGEGGVLGVGGTEMHASGRPLGRLLQQLQPADSLGTYAQVPLRDEEEAHILNLSLSSVFIW